MVRRRFPPLNALAAFEDVVEHGSFTAAAKARGVAQPSISRHVSLLEEWLGIALFRRQANSADLTPEGEELGRTVREAFDQIELTVRRIQERPAEPVVVGCSAAIAHLWLLPKLASLRAKYPDADLSIFSSEDYSDFDRAGIDLSIRFGSAETMGEKARLLIPERVIPVTSPSFAKRHHLTATSTPADYDPQWLLHHTRGHYGWLTWPSCYELQELDFPAAGKIRTYNSYPLLIERAIAGEGIVLGHCGPIDLHLEDRTLIPVGPVVGRKAHGFFLLAAKGAADKQNTPVITEWLFEQARLSAKILDRKSARASRYLR